MAFIASEGKVFMKPQQKSVAPEHIQDFVLYILAQQFPLKMMLNLTDIFFSVKMKWKCCLKIKQ